MSIAQFQGPSSRASSYPLKKRSICSSHGRFFGIRVFPPKKMVGHHYACESEVLVITYMLFPRTDAAGTGQTCVQMSLIQVSHGNQPPFPKRSCSSRKA